MNEDGVFLLSFFKSFSRNCHLVYFSLPEHSPMDLVHGDEVIDSHHLLGCFLVTEVEKWTVPTQKKKNPKTNMDRKNGTMFKSAQETHLILQTGNRNLSGKKHVPPIFVPGRRTSKNSSMVRLILGKFHEVFCQLVA